MENNYQKSIAVFSSMVDVYKSNQMAKKFKEFTISNMSPNDKIQMGFFILYAFFVSFCIGTYIKPNFYVLGNMWVILAILSHIGVFFSTMFFIINTEKNDVWSKLKIIGYYLKFFSSKFLFTITNPLRKILIKEQLKKISRDFQDCAVEISSFFEKIGNVQNFNLLVEEMRLPQKYTMDITDKLENYLEVFKNVELFPDVDTCKEIIVNKKSLIEKTEKSENVKFFEQS